VTPRDPVGVAGAAFPFLLNTGRLRDQWHTMTRTGLVPRLMAHRSEPFVAVHPDDTALHDGGLEDGALAELRSAHGLAVLRVCHDPGQRRGELFAPMHWGAALCGQGRVNSAVNRVNDPISGQPELKHTPVALASWEAGWYGFYLSVAPPPELAAWSALIAEPGGVWRQEIAGHGAPEAAFDALLARLEIGAAAPMLRDHYGERFRAAVIEAGRLRSVLFIGRTPTLPARAWLAGMIGAEVPAALRLAVLAGAPAGAEAVSPTICVCHGVDRATIAGAIACGARTLQAVGEASRAGTGCGSCRPEIRALLDAASVLEPA